MLSFRGEVALAVLDNILELSATDDCVVDVAFDR